MSAALLHVPRASMSMCCLVLALVLATLPSCAAPPARGEAVLRYETAAQPGDAPGPCSACGRIELRFLAGPGAGPLDADYVEALGEELRDAYGLEVVVSAPGALPPAALDAARGQYEAKVVLDAVEAVPASAAEGPTTLIALTNDDVFMSSIPEWKFVFGSRRWYDDGRAYAVISAYRMEGMSARRRMLVMAGKYIATMACGFPDTSDPTSIVFDNVLSSDDLDRMSATICHRAP